ncbi:MAG: hypothetical protein K2P84_06685 [Undibacterium sp.]|nr:hypothetical protein [Undibacterium sp.]
MKLSLITALIFISAAAYAHRFHAGISEIRFNPNTGNTEIVHTFMAHDVEALLENLYQKQFDLSDADDAQVFRNYLEKQFSISDQTQALPIKWVGLKVDPTSVVVFQEIEKRNLPEHANIRQATLTDFLPDQINTINIVKANAIQTMNFDRNSREQSIP